MAGLLLPGHVYQAQQRAKAKASAVPTPVDQPQVDARNGLEIYNLDTPIPEGIPTPERFLLFVMPVDVKDRIGSLFIPDSAVEAQLWVNGIGKVCAKGPGVYRGRRFEEQGLTPDDAPSVGDLVIYNAKSPNRIKIAGRTLILVADDAILARVDPAHAHKIVF